jgi:ABC-type uncharacterized transport system permease subunit
MWKLKAYWHVAATSAREDGANPQRLIVSMLQLIGRVALILAIYHVAYAFNPNPGMQFTNAMWSISTYFAFILGLDLRNIARVVDIEVKNGAVETGIVKPLDWRLVKVAEHLGKRGIEFLLQLIVLPLLLVFVVGLPDMSHATPLLILAEIACILLAMCAVASMFLMVGLSAFWLNDAMPLYRIVDKMAAVFCGSFVPFALLPTVIQNIIIWSPFGIYAAPQQIFNPGIGAIIVPTLISGLFWTAFMLLFCAFVWRRVERRIEVNGG